MKKTFFAILIIFTFCLSMFAQTQNTSSYSIERYLNIRSAVSPNFSPDGKKIAFRTNITGRLQIWMVDAEGGYPQQITAYDDSIRFVEWLSNGNGIIFGKAKGGDERNQFYWMSDDGSQIKKLTNDPRVRYFFASSSSDGKRIYYSSNKRNSKYFDIYSMEIPSGKERLIYKSDESNFLSAISDDESKLVIFRFSKRFSSDNDLYLYEKTTKKTTHLTPHDTPTQYTDTHFLPDGNSMILSTDKDAEFLTLAKMDLRTRKITPLEKANWDVEATTISSDGKTYAYTKNVEGYTELFIRNADDDFSTAKSIPLPGKGLTRNLRFSNDTSKLAFVFNSSTNVTDIWTYDFKKEKLTRVTKSSTFGIPQESFVEPELIKYETFDGRKIPAWYYIPKNPHEFILKGWISGPRNRKRSSRTNKKYPVIVDVHGGPNWQTRTNFNKLYQYYLSRGYAILAPNVRGSTGYGRTYSLLDNYKKREDAVKDLAFAAKWLKEKGNAHENKIAVMGGSYGGYMTLAAITLYPDLWAAAVNTVGVSNFETFLKSHSGLGLQTRQLEYGSLDKDLEFLRSISPIYKVDKIKTPLFVIHGKNDPRVPYTEAEQLVEALKKRNIPYEYKLYENEGHGISRLENRLELYPKVADFLDKYLK